MRRLHRARYRALACLIAAGLLAVLFCAALAAAPAQSVEDRTLSRGQQVANAVAAITGTAVSPLLGICLLGAYQWSRAVPAERISLPFYSHPTFWIPVAILLVLVMLKDTIGSAAPLMKKPLDAIEILVVNKAALFLAVFPVVIHEVAALAGARSVALFVPVVHAAGAGDSGAGAVPLVLATLAGAASAFVVWLAGHALDILALLSPFPLLDVLLKGFRALVCLSIALLAALNSQAALLFCVIVIAVCAVSFRWALRLVLFGSMFAWDLLSARIFGHRQNPREAGEVLASPAASLGGAPKRSLGTLRVTSGGDLEFTYRPLLVGFRRAIRLGRADNYAVGRGLFFPCLVDERPGRSDVRPVFRLLPRYSGFEQEIRDLLGLHAVRELWFPAQLRAALEWWQGRFA